MSQTVVSIALINGSDRVGANVKADGCQLQTVDVEVGPGESFEVAKYCPDRADLFYVCATGDLQVSTDAGFVNLHQGVPVLWYEGIGYDLDSLFGSSEDALVATNKSDKPVALTLRASRQLVLPKPEPTTNLPGPRQIDPAESSE